MKIKSKCLGQVGYILILNNVKLIIDPYLTNSLYKKDKSLNRLFKINYSQDDLKNTNFVLVTHEHQDHFDIESLKIIFEYSPNVKFILPPHLHFIIKENIPEANILEPNLKYKLAENLDVFLIPTAHPEFKFINSYSVSYAYIIDFEGSRIFHGGDFSLNEHFYSELLSYKEIDLAFIPVNENNFFKTRNGIIGNLTIREAFQLCEDLKVKKLIPTHWDMFLNNSVSYDEIELVYKTNKYSFQLVKYPKEITV